MMLHSKLVHLTEQLSHFAKQGESLRHALEHSNRNQTRSRKRLQQPNRKLRPAEIDELVDLYESGMDLTGLGRHFGMHRQTVRAHLLRRGISLRPQWEQLTAEQVADAARRYQAGVSTYQLGKQYDVGPDVIRRALVAQGVRMRPRWFAGPQPA